jgi:hypothetical protein
MEMPMLRLAFRRHLFLVLTFLLLVPWSAEALPIDRPLADAVSRLTGWLTALVGDVGCSMDPSGGCHESASQSGATGDHPDVGCSADPDGRCNDTSMSQPATTADHLDVGCSMDPDGGACGNRG